MSHFCAFCRVEHSSSSCFHPGHARLNEAEAEVARLRAQLQHVPPSEPEGVMIEEAKAILAARQRVRESFGHRDAVTGKCECVYCRGDVYGLAEHAADYELQLFSLQQKFDESHTEVARLRAQLAATQEQVGVRQLQRLNAERAKRWHQSDSGVAEWTPLEWAGAMCGEAGEAANAAKKLKRVRDKIQNVDARGETSGYTKDIAKEVADTVIYGALLCEAVGEDLQAALVEVFNAKSEEYNFPERLAALSGTAEPKEPQ